MPTPALELATDSWFRADFSDARSTMQLNPFDSASI